MWEIATVCVDTDECLALLADGWEPFAMTLVPRPSAVIGGGAGIVGFGGGLTTREAPQFDRYVSLRRWGSGDSR